MLWLPTCSQFLLIWEIISIFCILKKRKYNIRSFERQVGFIVLRHSMIVKNGMRYSTLVRNIWIYCTLRKVMRYIIKNVLRLNLGFWRRMYLDLILNNRHRMYLDLILNIWYRTQSHLIWNSWHRMDLHSIFNIGDRIYLILISNI